MGRSRRPARARKSSRDARPAGPAAGQRPERRVGAADRRAAPRGPDRRVGARTAARMAKERLDGDIAYVKRHLKEGNFWEVAKV
ncbi:MAG TPA: hypothetical protein VMV18_09340, partial [bacterium]|nr:hypothetical protein [bacterium]